MDRFDAGPQPAERTPAPGRLGYVQAFVNSFWDLGGGGADLWDTCERHAAWLAARGFEGRVQERDRRAAVELREALRAALVANHDGRCDPDVWRPVDAVERGTLIVRHDGAGAWLEPAGAAPGDARALAAGIVLEARRDGTWERFKACPGPHCGWGFYDHSRNRSSQWCSMRICGNRTKGASFRRRRRGEPAVG